MFLFTPSENVETLSSSVEKVWHRRCSLERLIDAAVSAFWENSSDDKQLPAAVYEQQEAATAKKRHPIRR